LPRTHAAAGRRDPRDKFAARASATPTLAVRQSAIRRTPHVMGVPRPSASPRSGRFAQGRAAAFG
jgi:hypothetical protein